MGDPLAPETGSNDRGTAGGDDETRLRAAAPTGNDGSLGADAPSGDAGLAGDADPVTGGAGSDRLPDFADIDDDALTDDDARADDHAPTQNA
jgi:hypothetical protein